MDRMEAEDFSLFGLLGRSWELDAAVVDVMFDKHLGAAAFALADGSVAIAKVKDREPATGRIRISAESGSSSILPRTKPLPPIIRFTVQESKPVAITAYGKHGFLLGDASGGLVSVTEGGERTPFAPSIDGSVTAIDHAAKTNWLAFATGGQTVFLKNKSEAENRALEHDTEITTLRFSPEGDFLAVAEQEAVTLWKIEEKAAAIATIPTPNRPLTLAWSPDQSGLAIGFEAGGACLLNISEATASDAAITIFPDYPTAVRSIAWSPDGTVMATSGAFRVIAWPVNDLTTDGGSPASLETGKPSLVTVESITTHPTRPLIAAGYENGMVIITQFGRSDELVIKTEGQGAVTKIAWSQDGGYLALGSDRGHAALVELPAQLFK
ncbi:MAG: WD40 repeat domain-containing protein [Geminicoccaceae bacterium]